MNEPADGATTLKKKAAEKLAAKAAPVVEEAPTAEAAPVVEEAPTAEVAPVVEDSPAAPEVVSQEEVVAVATTEETPQA
jgi:small subunit ribosomal protein S16